MNVLGLKRGVATSVLAMFLLLTAESTLAVSVAPAPAKLFDSHFLRSRSWRRTDTGLKSVVSDWPVYKGTQGFKEKKIVRQTTLEVAGVSFQADYRVFDTAGTQEIVLTTNRFDEQNCADLKARMIKAFGKPTTSADIKSEVLPRTLDEWDIHHTRVQLGCYGTRYQSAFTPLLAYLYYGTGEGVDTVKPDIYITCTEKRRVGAITAPVHDEPSINFIIDQNQNNLLHADGTPLGIIDSYSADRITAHGETALSKTRNIPWTYSLDRKTGTYEWDGDTGAASQPREQFQMWGQCRKVAKGGHL
ncbi:MAG: hypothetical protein ACRETO_11250 [Gammaproteobacteria bacterium]